MQTQRKQKIARLIKEVLSEHLLSELRFDISKNVLITISHVEVTVDFGIAFIYLSIFPFDKSDEILDIVEAKTKGIRLRLGKELGNQLRRIPNLEFRIDSSLDQLDKLNKELSGKGDNPKL